MSNETKQKELYREKFLFNILEFSQYAIRTIHSVIPLNDAGFSKEPYKTMQPILAKLDETIGLYLPDKEGAQKIQKPNFILLKTDLENTPVTNYIADLIILNLIRALKNYKRDIKDDNSHKLLTQVYKLNQDTVIWCRNYAAHVVPPIVLEKHIHRITRYTTSYTDLAATD
jgi:hypothetical protein